MFACGSEEMVLCCASKLVRVLMEFRMVDRGVLSKILTCPFKIDAESEKKKRVVIVKKRGGVCWIEWHGVQGAATCASDLCRF